MILFCVYKVSYIFRYLLIMSCYYDTSLDKGKAMLVLFPVQKN